MPGSGFGVGDSTYDHRSLSLARTSQLDTTRLGASEMILEPWSLDLKIIASAFHGTAIASTIFRLMYRWHMARFWWEDGWAALALLLDIICMACVWLEAPMIAGGGVPAIDKTTNWIVAVVFTSVLWVCRISILFSIVRIANPSQQPRRVALLIACSFVIMWAALVAQRIQICIEDHCEIAGSVALSQLITDVLSDFLLVAMPIRLLRRTKLSHRQRILIYSVFSATLLITAVTILHSIVLFTTVSDGIIVIGHVKTAVAVIVCNLLVIVTFVYRVICRDKAFDLDATEEIIEFTTIDLNMGITSSSHGTDSKQTHTTLFTSRGTTVSRSIQPSSEVEEKADVPAQ